MSSTRNIGTIKIDHFQKGNSRFLSQTRKPFVGSNRFHYPPQPPTPTPLNIARPLLRFQASFSAPAPPIRQFKWFLLFLETK